MTTVKVDLFSETNCSLSPAIRKAMAEARVGNEIAGEDPSVNRLVDKICLLLNKPAGIFLPSGMMCNLISFLAGVSTKGSHLFLHESAHPLQITPGALTGIVGATPQPLSGIGGIFEPTDFEERLEHLCPSSKVPPSAMVSIEQVTNLGGGCIWPLEKIRKVSQIAHHYGILRHMDGARLWHAMVAHGVAADVYAQEFDLVWVDFSKVLGAPMGAVLTGPIPLIERASYYKFQLGGGMHKAGVLAAACSYGLKHNFGEISRLHDLTQEFACQLVTIQGVRVPHVPETNIIFFEIDHLLLTVHHVHQILLERGIRMHLHNTQLRAIIHLDITESCLNYVVDQLKNILL